MVEGFGQSAARLSRLAVRTMIVTVAVATAVPVMSGCRGVAKTGTSTSSSTASRAPARQQVTVKISGQDSHFYPQAVAVDAQGDLYVAAVNEGVIRVAARDQASTRLPFSGVSFGESVGVDTAGNVYLGDDGNADLGRVLKLTPDGTQTVVPFTGLGQDPHLAVAGDGTVYVADSSNNRVLKLPPATRSQTALPFTDLKDPVALAVDSAGNVYVSDSGNSRVLMLAAGSTDQTVLPLQVQAQRGVAVDSSGSVYVTGAQGVTMLAKNSPQPSVLPIQGGKGLGGIAVDAAGNIFIVDRDHDGVIELKP